MTSEPIVRAQPFVAHPSIRPAPGAMVWVTGLAATGKSRLAAALSARLKADREVEVLDGEEVRRYLSKNPDGSCEGSASALARLGFVARLLARHGIIVIAPSVALDEATRSELRRAAEAERLRFVEVFMEADLDALIEAGPHRSGGARLEAPDVTVRPDWQDLDDSVNRIVHALVTAGVVTSSSVERGE